MRGIAQLVSSSVPGLQLSKVTITNASGGLMWPQAGGSESGGAGSSVQEAEQRYDASTAASLDAMLAQTLGDRQGAGARVREHERRSDQQGIARIRQGGHPSAAEQDARNAQRNRDGCRRRNRHRQPHDRRRRGRRGQVELQARKHHHLLGVNKTVTHSTIAPGTVESQHVSVLLDHSVPAASLPAIREAITNAAGIEPKRGDTISIGQVAFAKQPESAAAASSPLGYAKYALLGIGAALFLFFTTRSLRKREKETIDEPVWLRELDAPMRLSELERETAVRPPAVMAGVANGNGDASNGNGADGGESIRRQVEQLVDSNPDRVAQQLRTWMQED